MTEREIRGLLRSATERGLLTAWNGGGPFGACDHFYFYGPNIREGCRSIGDTVAFCYGLRDRGVLPVYRESEPSCGG